MKNYCLMLIKEKIRYVIDSGPIINLNNYFNEIFVTFWNQIDIIFKSGAIISSSEVFRELNQSDDIAFSLAKKYKEIFLKPDIKEQRLIKEILSKHKELIKQKNISRGLPVADPFVIAQAINYNAILITSESLKPNAHNIPNICKEYNIECIGLKDFFLKENWKF